MRLLILGASGGVGQWLTRLAAERGHQVTALVREPALVEFPGSVRAVRGDVTEPAMLDAAVNGHDAVLCALGQRRAGKSPTAKLLSPPDLMQRVARHLTTAMQRHNVQRLVVVSAAGVGDSFQRLSWAVQRLISTGKVAIQYRDLDEMEKVLAEGGLDWLAVRPVTLVDGAPTGRAIPVDRYGLLSRVRRADVAKWMLDAVEQKSAFLDRRVMLGS
jgi:uncharacterized protein YbjT (DUF2867 family)